EHVPGALWGEFQSSIKVSLNAALFFLSTLHKTEMYGVNFYLLIFFILSNEIPEIDRVNEFLQMEGPTLLNMRIKHLIKQNRAEKAAVLAKVCSEYPEYEGKGNFKQTYFVCLCVTKTQEQLMQEITQVDCKDALEMICNLESDGDEKGALCLCSAFLKRQLLQGDMYCAWELTLFWSKLLIRSESSGDSFLDQCRKLVLLSRNVCHILFLIKVIQSEVGGVGLPVCIEMCIRALQMASSDNTDSRTTICKTISCLLPTDFEVKQACQLTEFLNQPTVNSYYAVESLYNESDEKREDENLPVPNSLRCELLLALKTQWPFDPEFWDWRTLKRNCLALMGEEASIVSSIDTLNDTDEGLEDDAAEKGSEFKDLEDFILNTTNELNEIADEKEKNREAKKLREKGFVSARFRNWRAYMQYCVLCDKEFLGHRIVRHAQKHFKDGVYTCPICADSFNTKEILEPHVASHVKQSCKERLAAMKATRKLPKPMQSTSTEFTEDCVCPVTYCQKVFKFFRSLVTHVKAHKNDEEATRFLEIQRQKVVCQYCRRQFVNARHLNDHLQMHCGAKPYYCIQLNCTASFHCNSELLMHKRQHTDFKAGCMFPNCGRIFNEAYLLYDHEAQHYLTFTCKIANCGKIFYSQSQLNLHQQNHDTNEVPITSENHPVPKMEPSTQCSARQEETCSASVILDQKTEVVGNLSTPNTSDLAQKETSKPLDSHSLNTFPSVLTGGQSKPCPNKTEVWIELIQSKNNVGSPQKERKSNDSLSEKRSNTTSIAACQDDKVIEIQNALQMLDLVEAAHEKSLQENCSSKYNDRQSNAISSNNVMQKDSDQSMTTKMIMKEDQNRDNGPKPFKCEMDNCEYGFMTKEALFRHLARVHDYTIEMIEYLKKTPVKFSPYPCHICPKTFTRTTGLRIHYEKVHHLTQAEMNKLKHKSRGTCTVLGFLPSVNTSSNTKSFSHATEAISSQTVKPLPEKAGCSKNTISKDEVHVQKKEKVQKRLGLQLCDADNSFSPYRPYRCVHEGCAAAFTIQQNLILHCRAMHQSSLPLPSGDLDTDIPGQQAAEVQNNEIRCQVKDCSRIFPGITTLVQHYLLLHKFTRDKATVMMSSIKVGTFQCDRSECTLSFTSVEKYIDHIKNFHKEINISERGSVDQTFKCEYDGCDRVYTTKSNLLRHEMKKHNLIYIPRTQQQRTGVIPNNGKENIENKFKVKKKNTKKKDDKSPDHWTSFGKPSLKSMDEASAMCTKNFSLQYPCMIKGCDAVERAERNIFRHYTTHGLTERYIEDQRSQFIFCKKYPRSRFKDANKSEGMSTDASAEETDPNESEPEISKTTCQRQEALDGIIQAEAKLSTDASSESQSSTSEVKKRGRPLKSSRRALACPDRRLTLRNRPADKVYRLTDTLDQGFTASQEEETEDGVALDTLLKFLETSPSTHTPKRKMSGGSRTELPLKQQRTFQQKTANIICETPDIFIEACQNLVDFRNPLSLQSVNNVKIVMDKTFSNGAELLLKQLQDMRPMVLIKKVAS
uniref:C2H2-type domain-containing protein n=1 Tax=Oncorhynchus mykiss TaxID=8022 RepID=A0A8C7RCC4_ONCMY